MLVFINKIIQILVKMVDLAWWLTYLRINCYRRSKFTPTASWVWWICFLCQLNKQFAHLQIFKNRIRFHQSYKSLFFLQVLLAQRQFDLCRAWSMVRISISCLLYYGLFELLHHLGICRSTACHLVFDILVSFWYIHVFSKDYQIVFWDFSL